MTISNDEVTKLVNFIEEKVRSEATEQDKAGIAEIINQWRSDIEIGRQVERKVTVRQSPGLDVIADVPRSRRATSGDFIGREDYEPTEQLNMLLGALGMAYLAPQMMAQQFMQAIEDFGVIDEDAEVVPDVHLVGLGEIGESDEDSWSKISRANIEQSRTKTNRLSLLLSELSKEAGIKQRNFPQNQDLS
ncbi:hypothetical protein [Actibacterium pelagium]|uniref:Uncharacterized protein n=1 Tax=Actibacterium pelagium TaxID=2029103 RepID=A0A917EJ94_9RHOB|nr:hypothetical protein [Actibacterium pelagium]GGE43614.1 hypothetical protein GCM10011517_09130 [Actibacterium pelagium]